MCGLVIVIMESILKLRHIHLYAKTGYKPAAVTRCHELGKIAGPIVGRLVARVQWQQKDEPATEGNIPNELIEDFQSRREALGHMKLGRLNAAEKMRVKARGLGTPAPEAYLGAAVQPGPEETYRHKSNECSEPRP